MHQVQRNYYAAKVEYRAVMQRATDTDNDDLWDTNPNLAAEIAAQTWLQVNGPAAAEAMWNAETALLNWFVKHPRNKGMRNLLTTLVKSGNVQVRDELIGKALELPC